MTTNDISQPIASDLSLDLVPLEPLSPSARLARDAMLARLRTRLVARRRRRVAVRACSAFVLMAAALVGVRWVTAPTVGLTPTFETASRTSPTIPDAPRGPDDPLEQPKKFAITIIQTDATVLGRLSSKPPATPLIASLSDDELLDALQAAGTPGLIKINGRVVLSRDLLKPAEADDKSQSRDMSADHTHG